MNVYARTTVTRSLLELDGGHHRLAWLDGEPVRQSTVGPWTFLGAAETFAGANALVRMHGDMNARAAFMSPLAAGRAYGRSTFSVYQASAPRGGAGPSGLQWFAYTGRGPYDGWTKIEEV